MFRIRDAIWLPTLILTLFCMVHPALAGVSEEVSAYYDQAEQAFRDKDFKTTEIQLKNALQLNPNHVKSRVLMGKWFLSQGNPAAAEETFGVAEQAGAGRLDYLIPLGNALLQQRKYEKLLDTIQPLGLPNINQSEVEVLRGQAHLELGQLTQSQQAFERAIELNPLASGPLLGQAMILMKKGLHRAAQKKVDQALAIAPNDSRAFYMKGAILRFRGDYKQALFYLDRAIGESPRNLNARLARAGTLIDMGRHDDALPDIEEVRKLFPAEPQAAFLASQVYFHRKEEKKAMDYVTLAYRVIQSIEPALITRHPPTLKLAGTLAVLQGDNENAIKYLSETLKQSPNDLFARLKLAEIFIKQQTSDQAISLLKQGLKFHEGSAALYALIGQAYLNLEDYSQATAWLEKAAEVAPDDATIQIKLAQGRIGSNHEEGAIVSLERAFNSGAGNLADSAGVSLALIKIQREAYQKALAIVDSILKRSPNNVLAKNIRGSALRLIGDEKAAERIFRELLEEKPKFLAPRLNLARLYQRQRKYDEAHRVYQQILKEQPNHIETLVDMAKLEMRRENRDEALVYLEKLRTIAPTAFEAQGLLMQLYAEDKQKEQLYRIMQELRVAYKDNAEAQLTLAKAQLMIGEFALARQTLKRLSEMSAYNSRMLRQIARLQMRAGAPDDAFWSLKLAVTTGAASQITMNNLVMMQIQRGLYDDAKTTIAEIARIFPESGDADWLRGELAFIQGDMQQAASFYRQSQEKQPRSSTLARYYEALNRLNRAVEGKKALQEWIAKFPNDNRIKRLLVSAYLFDKQFAEALPLQQDLVRDFPREAEQRNNLALLYFETKDPRALQTAQALLAEEPDNPVYKDTLGWILIHSGQGPKGLNYLYEALEQAPDIPSIRYHVAHTLADKGLITEAAKELQTALNSERAFPERIEARALLATIQERAALKGKVVVD